MSEPADSPPAEPPQPPEEKPAKRNFLDKNGKFRPGAKLRAAILEVVSRQRAGWKPEYKVVAGKHGVNANTLKKTVSLYKAGRVEMCAEPPGVEDKKITLATEAERSTQNILAYEHYLNDVFEALLKRAKKEFKEGNFLAFDQLGIPKVISELSKARSLRTLVEKGNFAALEQLMELHKAREAQREAERLAPKINLTQNIVNVNGPMPAATPAAATAALTSQQRSIADILGDHRAKVPAAT